MKTARTTPKGNKLSDRNETRQIWLGGIVTGLFVIIAVLSSCTGPSVTPTASNITPSSPTEPPDTVTAPPATDLPSTSTEIPSIEPSGKGIACSGDGGKYTCLDPSGHIITLGNVPTGIAPYLFEISPSHEATLFAGGKAEDVGCVFVIVGDLAFYNEEEVKKGWDVSTPVKSFPTPVTITYTFTKEDLSDTLASKCGDHIKSLKIPESDITYVPVYFEKGWKTFPISDYTITPAAPSGDGTITVIITFKSWGDQPIGGSTHP